MRIDETQFDQFLAWLQAFDPSLLPNEAEVEAKFVVPLFQHLGYPEGCCRLQYPLKTYVPGTGRRGRKPAVDQIYFSASEQKEQNADTSLVIVEAKGPNETHLDEALEQAHFYGDRLSPLFLVVTNAHRLVVVKRHRHRKEERVFDVALHELQKQATAKQLYRQLHFEGVKRLKEQLADDLTHAHYVDLMHALHDHPDIRERLATGDFERSRMQVGRRLTVVEPKVAVVCDLPLAFGDGACRIAFSNVLLQGLTCHLTHRQILESLMTGLDTQHHWGTRRFLQKADDGSFEAQLGQTTVILSDQEAQELCICFDTVCHAYKAILVGTEDMLQTWDYLPISMPGSRLHGFTILTVEPWLWKLMRRFAHEFDFLAGTSPWHIFDRENFGLRVHHGQEVEHVLIYPSYGGNPVYLPQETTELLYCIEEDPYVAAMERGDQRSWKQMIGPHGIWTAQYTEHWLVNQFIPQVLMHYPLQSSRLWHPKRTRQPAYWAAHSPVEKDVPLAQFSIPTQLVPYLHQIQGWFYMYGDCQVAASLLRPYYTALTDVVRHIDPSQLESQYFGYIHGRVFGAARRANRAQFQAASEKEHSASEEPGDDRHQADEEVSPATMINEIIAGLDEHVRRIHLVEHESPETASYLSSALIALLDHGTIHCGQEHLNAAREAILPLLDLSRFERRYVLRPSWE
jgi:hypothetical protein